MTIRTKADLDREHGDSNAVDYAGRRSEAYTCAVFIAARKAAADTAAQMLLLVLIFYLKYEAPEDEQNFAMVMEMLRAGDVDEEDSNAPSALDTLFYDLRKTDPDHIALKY